MGEQDSSYKLLFSHACMVEDLLRGFVHEDWVEKLDFSSLERYNAGFVTDDIRERLDDIIWRVRWGDDWLYVYLLIEFQSSVDHWMAVRIMTYVGLLYQDLIRSGQLKVGSKLPPVLPLVLYNGERKWVAATDIHDMITEAPGSLGNYLPRLKYLLLAERDYQDSELEKLNNLVAALFRLENSRTPELMQQVVILLLEWLGDVKQDSLRRAFTVWFSRVIFPKKFGGEEPPAIEELYEVKTMLAERIEQWKQEYQKQGLQEGLQEGLQQGMQQGMHKGSLRILARQMEKKFGSLPEEVMERLNDADEDQILEWSERVLVCSTIEEMFA